MKEGPDIATVAALIGDPARANILTALMSGKALTAGELAREAGVQVQTASSHLARLESGGMIKARKSGRHRFFTLANEDVAHVLEALMGLAAGAGHMRVRTGPRDQDLRKARVCYNHLAGEMGVRMYRSLLDKQVLVQKADGLSLGHEAAPFFDAMGLDLNAQPQSRAPMCRECLDWSARESHLAGRLGRALLTHFIDTGWATRRIDSRAVTFTEKGTAQFTEVFGPPLALE